MSLLWLSLALIVGILAAKALPLPAAAWLSVAAGSLALLALSKSRWGRSLTFPANRISSALQAAWARIRLPVPFMALLVCLALGAARFQAAQPDLASPASLHTYTGNKFTYIIEGWLAAEPEARDSYTNLRVQVERLRTEDSLYFDDVEGLLLVRAPLQEDWRYGDRLRLRGQLQTPASDEWFPYREYLARQGVYAIMPTSEVQRIGEGAGSPLLAALYAYRESLLALVYRLAPDPEASLIAGILLGHESGISRDVQRAFQDTGTAHIIAISGFNITILAGLFSWLFGRLLGRWRGLVLSVVAIALYTLLVGAAPAAVRAALMGGLSLFARQLGRRQDGLNSLGLVTVAMCLHDPQVLWDIGFQLSLAATLGLVLYAGSLTQAFAGWAERVLPVQAARVVSRLLGEYVLFTLAAQVTVLPVIAYHFREISLLSLIANPLVLPAQPALMILAGLALLLGQLWYPLGQLLALAAWPFAAYTIRMLEWLAGFPGIVLYLGSVSLGVVTIYYLLLLGVTFFRNTILAHLPRLRPAILLTGLLILNVIAWREVYAAADGRLHVYVFDVSRSGQSGDAILIRTPAGRSVLVNGGPSAAQLSESLGRWLPYSRRQLDLLVVANPQDANIQSLPAVLPRFPPEGVIWAGPTHGSYSARSLQQWFSQRGLAPLQAEAGQVIDLGDQVELHIEAVGRRGAVLVLTWRNFRLLLPHGLDFEMLDAWQASHAMAPVTAMLLADSGYAPLNPSEWLAGLQPQALLLSVSAMDAGGLPDPETLQAVEGYPLLRTDRHGWIELTTDGEQMWIEVERR